METTALILTRFGVTVNTTKWSSWVVCHLEKSQKLRYLCNCLTDLYEIWYADAK